MAPQVGLNTGLGNICYMQPMSAAYNRPNNLNSTNNLFNFAGSYTPVGNNYENDMMMANIDFSQIGAASTGNANANTPAVQSQLTGNLSTEQNNSLTAKTPVLSFKGNDANPVNETRQEQNELDGYLVQKDKNVGYTESNNRYVKSNGYKKAGFVAGLLAPMTGKIVKLFKGGKFKELFRFKPLAIACPAVALAGLGIGALLDGHINSKRAKAADENAAKNNVYTQAAQAMNAVA